MNYKLVVYIPEKALKRVKKALFEAGAGHQGMYDCCCWQYLGTGQFRPLLASNPHIGTIGKLEKVVEWRVEILVEASLASAVKQALLKSHPYEEPAFEFIACAEID